MHSSFSDGVVNFVIHVINQIMNGWRITKSVLYFIQYITLIYNYIKYQSFKYWCIFFIWQLFVFQYKITSIKSDMFNNITMRYRFWIFLLYVFFTFYDLQYMYMHNVCSLRTIYTTYSNSTTKLRNILMPVKHIRTM